MEGLEEDEAVLHRHPRVVRGVEQERRRRAAGDVELVRELEDELRVRRLAEQALPRARVRERGGEGDDRVGEDHEIRVRAHALHRIGRLRVAFVEVRARRRGQVPAGGKTQDADARGIHRPVARAGTDEAQRALRVGERSGMAVARSDAVLQHERGHAEGVQPLGDLLSLVVAGQGAVAAAGTDDDRGPVGPRGGHGIQRELGLVLGLPAEGSGSAIRPEQHGLAIAVRGVHGAASVGAGSRARRLGGGGGRDREKDRHDRPRLHARSRQTRARTSPARNQPTV